MEGPSADRDVRVNLSVHKELQESVPKTEIGLVNISEDALSLQVTVLSESVKAEVGHE